MSKFYPFLRIIKVSYSWCLRGGERGRINVINSRQGMIDYFFQPKFYSLCRIIEAGAKEGEGSFAT